MGLATVIGILIIFFIWNNYTSPVNEAGRNYKKVIKSYEGSQIQSIEDVHERMNVLDTHFNSPTFSKMQGGEKVDVTSDDMKTLFGTPDLILTDVDVPFMDTVNQYVYNDFVLNLHQNQNSIETFVKEDYAGVLYDEQELTELYFDIINEHLADGIPIEKEGIKLPIEAMWTLIDENVPTREIYKNGWKRDYQNHIFYFDDGQGKNAPEEYLNLQLQQEKEATELQFMERRFNNPFLKLDTKEEAIAKQEALLKYKEFERAKNNGEEVEPYYFRELAEEFGEIAKLHYRFRNGEVWVSWLSLQENGESIEIRGEVRLTETTIPRNISDIMDLKVRRVITLKENNIEDLRETASFIGQ